MNYKLIARIAILCLIIFYPISFEFKGYFQRKLFFETKINDLVIKVDKNWTGRSLDYWINKKVVFTLINSVDKNLQFGDSIEKKKDSWKFEVFRKGTDGRYNFYKSYNLKEE